MFVEIGVNIGPAARQPETGCPGLDLLGPSAHVIEPLKGEEHNVSF